MANIHVNPKTGDPGRCDAKIACRFGSDTPHFNTAEEARAAYEERNTHKLFTPAMKKRSLKMVALGGAMVATFSLTGCGSISGGGSNVDPRTQQTSNIQVQHADGSVTGGNPAGNITPTPAVSSTASSTSNPTLNVDDLQQRTEKLKNKLGGAFSNLTDKASSVAGEVSTAVDNTSSSSSTPSSSTTDLSRVYFQGEPLKPSAAEVEEAKQTLQKLRISTVDPNVDYVRSRDYGKSFDTGVVGRLEHRDVTQGVFKNSAPQSRAIGGSFIDPYTGDKVDVSIKDTHDTNVDHLVPLKRASELGGGEWNSAGNAEIRHHFANDPINTEVVGASENQSKGDKGPAEWMVPSYQPAQCTYAVHVIKVVNKYQGYGLGVTSADQKALANVLQNRCE